MGILRGFTQVERLIVLAGVGILIASIVVFIVFGIPKLLNPRVHIGPFYLDPKEYRISKELESFFLDDHRYVGPGAILNSWVEENPIEIPPIEDRSFSKAAWQDWPADFDGPLRLPPLMYAPSNGTACLGLIVNDERRHGGR